MVQTCFASYKKLKFFKHALFLGSLNVADIICLQETKLKSNSRSIILSLWACSYVDWSFLASEAASGGVLLM